MKYALIIGNNKYDEQKLAKLKTPAADLQALAKILVALCAFPALLFFLLRK